MQVKPSCTLCKTPSEHFTNDKKRGYFRCPQCQLIFADPAAQLSLADEKALYDVHENSPDDPGYRKFLSQVSVPLMTKLVPGMHGLDFGCGPGPTLNLMLEEQGMTVDLYDIFYAPDQGQLSTRYDFVTATEVVEHFSTPAVAWLEMVGLVKPGGWLAVMTAMFTAADPDNFKTWSYKNDPTHVSFYAPTTMHWIANAYHLKCHFISDRVILFQVPDSGTIPGTKISTKTSTSTKRAG